MKREGDSIFVLFMNPFYWSTAEALAFIVVYLYLQGDLGWIVNKLLKAFALFVLGIVVITIAGLFILHHKTNKKVIATVSHVENSSTIGGYYQKLSVKFDYDGNEYEVNDIDTANLLAEEGDKYYVYFSTNNPKEIKHIEKEDKVPTIMQVFISSLKYALIGIIVLFVLIKIIKRRI